MLGTAQELGMLGIVSKSGVVFSRLEDGGLTSLSGDVGPDWIGIKEKLFITKNWGFRVF